MPQLAQGLGFDLPHPLPRHVELFAQFFQCAGPAILQPEPQCDHPLFPGRQALEHVHQFPAQQLPPGFVHRNTRFLILDEILQMGILFLAHRRFQTDGILCQLLGERNEEALDGLLDKEQQKFMKAFGKSLLSVTRTQYGLALLKDQDTEKGEELRKRFEKQAKVYPYESDIQSERELMDQIDISFKEQTGQMIGPEKEITYETGSKRS